MTEAHKYKKKLIEVALPLEEINKHSSKEKSVRFGHPVTLHQYWARRPHASAAAVIFCSLIDDPSNEHNEKEANRIRKNLFKILIDHITWENYNNKSVFKKTHKFLLENIKGNLPTISDPFCGGGTIPIEAQRFGLKSIGSDLNPVAVMITKSMVEILPKFYGKKPINKINSLTTSNNMYNDNYNGFIEDFEYYSKYVFSQAKNSLIQYYPKSDYLSFRIIQPVRRFFHAYFSLREQTE